MAWLGMITSAMQQRPSLSLTVVQAPPESALTGKSFHRSGPTVLIGRGLGCDVVLPSRSVSGEHARIELGSTVTIKALSSTSITAVGEVTISPNDEPRDLPSPALLQLGPVVIKVEHAVTVPFVDLIRMPLPSSSAPFAGQLTIRRHQQHIEVMWGAAPLRIRATTSSFLATLARCPGRVVLYSDLGRLNHAQQATYARSAFNEHLKNSAVDHSTVRTILSQASVPTTNVEDDALCRLLVRNERHAGYALMFSESYVSYVDMTAPDGS